ncbi:hypothetical protein D3C76_1432840 [compost metagenome]
MVENQTARKRSDDPRYPEEHQRQNRLPGCAPSLRHDRIQMLHRRGIKKHEGHPLKQLQQNDHPRLIREGGQSEAKHVKHAGPGDQLQFIPPLQKPMHHGEAQKLHHRHDEPGGSHDRKAPAHLPDINADIGVVSAMRQRQ